MQSLSQGRPYQGYPYIEPIVSDVPSIDSSTANRWANLPRRPYQTSEPGPSGAGPSGVRPGPSGRPEASGAPVEIHRPSVVSPGSSGSGPSSVSSQRPPRPPAPKPPGSPKKDKEPSPVVYIDLPEDGSQVSQNAQSTPQSDEPDFVQDTIMYDPFENRRIDSPKEDTRSIASDSTVSGGGTYTRPNPPNTLNLGSPGSNGSPTRLAPPLPIFMTKESQIYEGSSNSFSITPVNMAEFPEPPPAYTEAAAAQTANPTPSLQITQPEIPPRTQVILPKPPVVTPSYSQPYGPPHHDTAYGQPIYGALQGDRKNMTCHHCGVRVHTLVIKTVGFMTHVIACLFFIFFMPGVLLVYCTDLFNHKNHYCPNCNKRIAYQLPPCGEKLYYDPPA